MYKILTKLLIVPIICLALASPLGVAESQGTIVSFSKSGYKEAYDIHSEYEESILYDEGVLTNVEPVIQEEPRDPVPADQEIYNYLTEELGFSKAAACGILGNIAYETGWTFNPEIGSEYGCYGLIQWLGSRLEQMKSWCNEAGRDYSTMQGQMDFVLWELENTDTYGTLSYLAKCEDSADGAYNAGWYFCYWFERPSDSSVQSNYRGLEAAKYYGMYAED